MQFNEVVDAVSDRWLSSIDKEEPGIADEFLRQMKDAVRDIHRSEGYPAGKVFGARVSDDDWLTKLVADNKQMFRAIPAPTTDNQWARYYE